jgi:hypothetical protein
MIGAIRNMGLVRLTWFFRAPKVFPSYTCVLFTTTNYVRQRVKPFATTVVNFTTFREVGVGSYVSIDYLNSPLHEVSVPIALKCSDGFTIG